MRNNTLLANVFVFAGLSSAGCVQALPPNLSPSWVHEVETEDGWVLPLRRYRGDGLPVLLVHGMGANHYNWDYREDVSLAAYLQASGWDVWVAVLRGDQGSTAPSRDALRRYSIDAFARLDIPVIIDHIIEQTDAPRVAWVGHSMGGMLLYTALSDHPDRISAGVAIASPARFDDVPPLHKLASAGGRWAPKRGRAPYEDLARASRGLGRANPALSIIANPKNIDPGLLKGLSSMAIVDVPYVINRQVSGWLSSGHILTPDGEPWLRASQPVPLLVVAGNVDRVVPVANVLAACEIFPACTSVVAGPGDGFSTDYGHVDLVMGRTAQAEIYPLVEAFLSEHAGDPARAVSPSTAQGPGGPG